jgi:hypothetical protein
MEQLVSFCYFVIGSKLVKLQKGKNNNETRWIWICIGEFHSTAPIF